MLFCSWLSSAAAASPHTPHTTDRQTGWVPVGGGVGVPKPSWFEVELEGLEWVCVCMHVCVRRVIITPDSIIHPLEQEMHATFSFHPLRPTHHSKKTCSPLHMSTCPRTPLKRLPAVIGSQDTQTNTGRSCLDVRSRNGPFSPASP